MNVRNCLAIIMISLIITGCGKKEIVGTQKIAAQVRHLPNFSSINVSGYYNITVTVGKPQSLVVKMNQNLLPFIETTVKGEELTVKSKKGYILRPQGIPEMIIVIPSLNQIDLSGNNNLNLHAFMGSSLDLNFAGSTQFVGQGVVKSLNIEVSGNNYLDTQKLLADKVNLNSNGNAKIVVSAKDKLKIVISGDALVSYVGDPKISQTINGSGTISKLQETINK